MLSSSEIAAANLKDWRKLAQGLHARYLIDNFQEGARFVTRVSEAGSEIGHHPGVAMADSYVDLKLVSPDAVYREGSKEHIVEWVTQKDIEMARRVSSIAAQQGLTADPASVSMIELGLDTARSAVIAPVWAALMTGEPSAQGHGSPSDEIRDATNRVPNLWFADEVSGKTAVQRLHLEIYVASEVIELRVAAAVAAGASVVEESSSPSSVVIADQDGNTAVLIVA